MKTIEEVKRFRNVLETTFYDYTFYEINQRRKDGLFRKYVFIFRNGRDVSEEIGRILNWKTSRSQRFHGALMGGGYGFSLSSYITDAMRMRVFGPWWY
jgi:hypothetical protein